MSDHADLSRRTFLGTAAATSAATLLASNAIGKEQPTTDSSASIGHSKNDKINMGVIGTGGMGHGHLRNIMSRKEADNVSVGRVCDVYRRRLNSALKVTDNPSDRGTMDYRYVLDDPDIDAVLIATPDHWHTKIAIDAMEAGKDVYVEKPLSLTTDQAIACRDAVHRTGRVLQVGPQGTSDGRYWKASKAIADGRIGKVTWSQGSYCRNSRGGQFNWHIDPDAGPGGTNDGFVWWDQWLGHKHGLTEKIPWNADHFFRFRKYWAYNGGLATDLLYHKLAPLLLAVSGPNGEYPKRVVAAGGRYLEKDDRDIPDNFFMMAEYPGEHTIMLVSVMTNDTNIPVQIHGQYGSIDFDNALSLSEQRTWWPEFRKANDDLLEHSMVKDENGKEHPRPAEGQAKLEMVGESRPDHMGAFLGAIRGQCEPACNVDLGCSTMVAIKMAVESYRTGQALRWDPRTEQIVPA